MRTRLLMLLILLVCTRGVLAGESGRVPVPVLPAADATACVEPVEIMRKEHMHMLLHQRDRTVHEAYRDKRHSLVGCIKCHVQRDAAGQTIPVNAPGQFCAECHAYTGVSMDCFECHATTPDSGRRQQ